MTALRLAAWLALATLSGAALAQDVPATKSDGQDVAALTPLHTGYAIDSPDILIRQLLFGRAHGLSLLAGACLDVPEQAPASQEAYARWHARQAAVIRDMYATLASYYFGARAGEAAWSDLAHALTLTEDIRVALGDVGLDEACRTLPTVLVGRRYAFDQLLAEFAAEGGDAAAKVGADGTPPLQPAAPAAPGAGPQ